jgi:hypothetical protein
MSLPALIGRYFFLAALFLITWPALAHAQFGYPYDSGVNYVVDRSEAVDADYTPVIALSPDELKGLKTILRALDQRYLRAEFFEKPLTECVALLQADLGLPIMIDERALADASIGKDTPITKRMPGATARDFLTAMLADHSLAWVPLHDRILITTIEDREMNPKNFLRVVYPVYDLVRVIESGRETLDFDALIDSITTTVQPESWRDSGYGEGVITPLPTNASIIVVQTWQVHEKVNQLLTSLRQVRRQQGIRGLRIERSAQGLFTVADDRDLPRPPRRDRTRWTADAIDPMEPESVRAAPVGGVF